MNDFKVTHNQPKFLPKEERLRLKALLPKPEVKSSVSPVRSRSPRAIQAPSQPVQVAKRPLLDILKYRSTFRFEWDSKDDTEQDSLMPRVPVGSASSASSAGSIRPGKPSGREKDDLADEDINKKPPALMTARDWRILKENFFIETYSTSVLPFRSWDESPIDRALKRALAKARYFAPTAIQMQGIPVSMTRQDMIGISYTGSGKSAAYLLPLIQHCLQLPRLEFESARDGPYALVLSPTRELAQQLAEECEVLSRYTEVRTYSVVGGKNIETQRTELTTGAEILIATPGRLLDLLKSNYVVFNQCFWLVVDEADKIFLLELAETIKEIFSYFPQEHWKRPGHCEDGAGGKFITLQIFSATIDAQVEQFWRNFLKNPATVRISDFSRKIVQKFEFLNDGDKRSRIRRLLKDVQLPALVFVNERVTADALGNFLQDVWKVACLHGDKAQGVREAVMDKFREGRLQVLITTDVFSRGISVKGLKVVINFDCPKSIIDYEHRIGRTGRMGQKGTAISFITPEDQVILPQIVNYLQKTSQKIPEELKEFMQVHKAQSQIID